MRSIIFLVLFLMALANVSCKGGDEVYLYRGESTGSIVTFDFKKSLVFSGHSKNYLGRCREFRYCIEVGVEPIFAIDTSLLHVGGEWQARDTFFKVVSDDGGVIYSIQSRDVGGDYWFVYSVEDGITKYRVGVDGEWYLVEGGKGIFSKN